MCRAKKKIVSLSTRALLSFSHSPRLTLGPLSALSLAPASLAPVCPSKPSRRAPEASFSSDMMFLVPRCPEDACFCSSPRRSAAAAAATAATALLNAESDPISPASFFTIEPLFRMSCRIPSSLPERLEWCRNWPRWSCPKKPSSHSAPNAAVAVVAAVVGALILFKGPLSSEPSLAFSASIRSLALASCALESPGALFPVPRKEEQPCSRE